MLEFLWKRNSSLLGKNLPKESWLTLNPSNVEGKLLGIWEGLFFSIDSWNWIESHLQRMLDFSKGSCGFILYFAAHLSRARHSSAFYIFPFGTRAVSIQPLLHVRCHLACEVFWPLKTDVLTHLCALGTQQENVAFETEFDRWTCSLIRRDRLRRCASLRPLKSLPDCRVWWEPSMLRAAACAAAAARTSRPPLAAPPSLSLCVAEALPPRARAIDKCTKLVT